MSTHINLHLLRVFFTVVERQGFSRAAEALFVSQSAVSKAVRELEWQLDLPLIERVGPGKRSAAGLKLTDSGQALYEHARGIFAMERVALEDIRDRRNARRGRLCIGASSTVAAYWLPKYISQFIRHTPEIDFEIMVGNTDKISRAVANAQVDVGFVEGAATVQGIRSFIWAKEPLGIIVPGDFNVRRQASRTINALAAEVWLVREKGSGTRQFADNLLQSLGISPAKHVEFGSNESIAQSVANGAGVAVVPEVVVHDLLASRRVKKLRIPSATMTRPLYFLELENRPRSPALKAFIAERKYSGVEYLGAGIEKR